MAEAGHEVVWSPHAKAELDEAVAYIAAGSAHFALTLLESALAAAESLPRFPLRGRSVPELGDLSLREIQVGPYRLVYRVARSQIQVVAFLHGARDFRRAWKERPSR